MTDDQYSPRPVAAWYMIGAIGALVFMLIACAGYVLDVTMDPASLPLDQQAVMEARPVWMVAAYAIAGCLVTAASLLFVRETRGIDLKDAG